jgi:hypothetical protein
MLLYAPSTCNTQTPSKSAEVYSVGDWFEHPSGLRLSEMWLFEEFLCPCSKITGVPHTGQRHLYPNRSKIIKL